MKNNFEYYSLLYAIIGDTIGFGNGITKYNKYENMKCISNNDALNLSGWTNYHLYSFISNGGYSGFNIDKLNVSESSIFMLSVYEALTNFKVKYNKDLIIKNVILKMTNSYNEDKLKINRSYDDVTLEKLKKHNEKNDFKNISYNDSDLGSEPLVRGIAIGLKYSGEKNRNKLLELSIEVTKITHSNPTSFIGTFATALFISLAIEKVDPNKWIDILMTFLIDGKILNFLKETIPKNLSNEIKYYVKDIVEYQYLLNKYKQIRFDMKKDKFLSSTNGGSKYLMILNDRCFYFYKQFGSHGIFNPGSNGLDGILYAYDSFMESGSSFEKLIYNSMLHSGQTNVTGCIAGALFGAYYGNKDLPNNLSNIELKDKLNKLVA